MLEAQPRMLHTVSIYKYMYVHVAVSSLDSAFEAYSLGCTAASDTRKHRQGPSYGGILSEVHLALALGSSHIQALL